MSRQLSLCLLLSVAASTACAGVGDPQVRTDHPWYPGELACSTFARLFQTQAEVFQRVTGRPAASDEDKVLAAWLWRCAHYYHGEEGFEDVWGKGFGRGGDVRNREYWTGLFAHGFGLCGTTHSQWVPEINALLGHGRGRGVGVAGHNTFEAFLTGGPYGAGQWVLLDHDQCTVVFDTAGRRLLSMKEVAADWKRLTDASYLPQRQRGWPVCGLHPSDATTYAEYRVAEYLAGYSGPPPMVQLRRGEKLRRYLQPGLDDGKSFVFWGRNYAAGSIPGPERSLTWVNQPEKMFGARGSVPHRAGQARYGNAVYVYQPDFAGGDYKEGVVAEDDRHVVFEFYTPYIIGAAPAHAGEWGVYDKGCRSGLVLRGEANCAVAVSVDQGQTWHECGELRRDLDLTDHVKGRRQYLLRLGAPARALAGSGLTITTVCQANPALMPRLQDGGSTVSFESSGSALISAGPNVPQAQAHVVEGRFGTPRVTLQLAAPRGEPVVAVHAAAHVQSGNPPRPDVKYQIEASSDGGKTWQPVVRDWRVERRGDEPADFWSQSMCWGSLRFATPVTGPVRVRFSNDGGRSYARCEAHLVYRPVRQDRTRVTFAWSDNSGARQASHVFESQAKETWPVPTGAQVQTRWVEFEPAH